MKEKIKKYVDKLFSGIYDTKQLNELKEEISANLLENISDFITKGTSEDEAFNKAVSNLGDMSELIASLKKASDIKANHQKFTIDKNHVIAYSIASAVVIAGLLISVYVYLAEKSLFYALTCLFPFILVSAPIYIYFGLTQEFEHDYGMTGKRAFLYSTASEVLLFGLAIGAVEYFHQVSLSVLFITLAPFILLSAVMFISLGLTEKSRKKMDSQWAKQWVEYYSNPNFMMIRGGISGALWIFAFGAFFFIGIVWGWKFCWIPIVVAIGCEPLIEAVFSAKNRNKKDD